MELKLTVLSSLSIQEKRPWPSLGWLQEVIMFNTASSKSTKCMIRFIFLQSGQDKCGMYLFNKNQLCQLSVETGKTVKKFASLSNIQISILSCSSNGAHLAGLISSGDLFIWHKSSDSLDIHLSPFSQMAVKVKSNVHLYSGRLTVCV